MQEVVSLSELTGKCVVDGWVPATKALPVVDSDLRGYFDLDSTIIPAEDVINYNVANDVLTPVVGHTGVQNEYLLNKCKEVRNIRNYFIASGNTVTGINSFKVENSDSNEVVSLSELGGKCVADGWDRVAKTIPTGDHDLRNYFDIDDTIIPVGDTLNYDVVNDIPTPVAGHTGVQQEYLMGLCKQIRDIRDQFILGGNTVTSINGFKVVTP